MALPFELEVLLEGDHADFGSCRLWGHTIEILKTEHKNLKEFDGLCIWYRGKMTVCLAPRVFRTKKRFAEILSHELTHAVEYLNDPEFLSPVMSDGCSQLAQAMETAWPEMLRTLKLPRGFSLSGK